MCARKLNFTPLSVIHLLLGKPLPKNLSATFPRELNDPAQAESSLTSYNNSVKILLLFGVSGVSRCWGQALR